MTENPHRISVTVHLSLEVATAPPHINIELRPQNHQVVHTPTVMASTALTLDKGRRRARARSEGKYEIRQITGFLTHSDH